MTREIPLRYVTGPITVGFTLFLLLLFLEQKKLEWYGISTDAKVVDARSSLARIKDGGLSLQLDYDLNERHFTIWHNLSNFEPMRKVGDVYRMRCHYDNPTRCVGEGPGPWVLLSGALFFSILLWILTLIFWRKKFKV